MEAATLSSPHRKCNIVPVQKSLSLPSYARASGEGIDHRIIFAALEQKEKIRRKSKIFSREKSARQNIFCLPISTGAKCRETSLSSDTSCSSLEYQKPKASEKPKKEELAKRNQLEHSANKPVTVKTIPIESGTKLGHDDVAARTVLENDRDYKSPRLVEQRKGYRSPSDTLRPSMNSSDSMERSSRSSNDSLSRRERLVAIKAKVEAAREKYGESSSEEESRSSISRYNSDGVIHRTVREVKSRSTRLEKRLRRRSQDEYALKKAYRKNNLSLCLNSAEDGIRLNLERPNILEDVLNLECKTDFCPSPNFPELGKKNYFSDFPNREFASRIVQTRIRHIEEEERKRRDDSDTRDKLRASSKQNLQNIENCSPYSSERRNSYSRNLSDNPGVEKTITNSYSFNRSSPIPRASQAPTPPPRSPKSMQFINKAYIQHQTSYMNKDCHSLEGKHHFQANIPVTSPTRSVDKVSYVNNVDRREETRDSLEKRRMRELLSSRRKTCGFFDYTEKDIFKEINAASEMNLLSKPSRNEMATQTSGISPKMFNPKDCFANSGTSSNVLGDSNQQSRRNRFQENERKQEFMFNSLESKKKSNSWKRQSFSPENDCLCYLVTDVSACTCNSQNYSNSGNSVVKSNRDNVIEAQQTCNRLCKSDVNISSSDNAKFTSIVVNKCDNLYGSVKKSAKLPNTKQNMNPIDKFTASANLESAMEELESVYRSLKFSSDNLSEKNSNSNQSLNDINADPVRYEPLSRNLNTSLHSRSAITKFNDLNSYESVGNKPVVSEEPLNCFVSQSASSQTKNLAVNSSKDKNAEDICIDELFSDLTRQLDSMEQNLTKESEDYRNGKQLNAHNAKYTKDGHKRATPIESIVNIRKELYDNLEKSSRKPLNTSASVKNITDRLEDQPSVISRKKYKAVRSLSENIAYLMATTNSNPPSPKQSHTRHCNLESSVTEASLKPYEHKVQDLLKPEQKRENTPKQPYIPARKFSIDKIKNGGEEIRQIRVSMDSNVCESKAAKQAKIPEYPRLSSAVCKQQVSPKNECLNLAPCSSESPKGFMNMFDESGLEKLLNTLLSDIPDAKHSSLLQPRDSESPTSATGAGKFDDVKSKRNLLPSKMDAYLAAAAKCNAMNAEGIQRVTPKESAQVKNDICQNTAHLNQTSFIPVYSKTTVCHKFPRSKNDCENPSPDKSLTTYSPPARHRALIGQGDAMSPRMVKTRMRRRSVGFEDLTSLSSYGHNFAKDIRFQEPMCNSNVSYSASASHNNYMNPDNNIHVGKSRLSEDNSFSFNHNSALNFGENENIIHRKSEKASYKDKSSKRKSSLNRIDFIHFPSSASSSGAHRRDTSQQNSSSDESTDKSCSKKYESLVTYSKRKHFGSSSHSTKEVRTNEVSVNNSPLNSRSRCNLPKSTHSSTLSPRPSRWKHIAASKFCQKLSHSAGELESLTDCSEIYKNKSYLSAQEYDASECCSGGVISKISLKNSSISSTDKARKSAKDCDYSSQLDSRKMLMSDHDSASSDKVLANELSLRLESCDSQKPSDDAVTSLGKVKMTEPEKLSGEEIDGLVEESTSKLDGLELKENASDGIEIYVSADEGAETVNSDGERRPSSILRKKSFEERKELHSILKPPPEDKMSKFPPSILKHRESSEEKDSGDLHSILKKSGSEDESCNSGTDIRPILKQSTDEESPGGTLRPRPILKKRTSFSDDCSYTNISSSELKPILKKKTVLSLSLEEQPKPILKSRRKSEDSRSTMVEVVASRPRAYSADMGIKANHENQPDGLESKEEFHKLDNDLL